MGGKRNGRRKHLYVSAAGLIILVLFACAPPPVRPTECPGCPPCPLCPEQGLLKSVEALVDRGDFEAAMTECQEVLARSPREAPGDIALMNLGLLSIHYANPRKDYQRALGYFQRMEKEFPQSPFAEEARVWVSVLRAFEKARQVDLEIEQMKKGLGK